MDNVAKDLTTLLNDDTVQIGDDAVRVTPFKFRHLPRAAAMVAKYWTVFEGLSSDQELDAEKALRLLPELIIDMGDDLFNLIEWCTGREPSWAQDLEVDDGITLLTKVIEVNFDFFTQQIAPKLQALGASVQAAGE